MNFSFMLSLLMTFAIVFFNYEIMNTINFSLVVLFFISSFNFLNYFFSSFCVEALQKGDILISNKKLKLKIEEIINKNGTLIKNNQALRKDLIVQNLRNAHLSLVIASLTKNQEVFENTLKELETLGITKNILEKYENLLNLINLIETNKIEIIISPEEKKLIFKDKENKVSS